MVQQYGSLLDVVALLKMYDERSVVVFIMIESCILAVVIILEVCFVQFHVVLLIVELLYF